ncbi:MAG: hypothetical protein LBQ74_20085 [Prevotella sp.]|jgi:hypothetical protein|nr:hypothetical protein [Prevotella sp.]
MAQKAIKIKDPQPEPCPNCGGFYGYKYYDTFRMAYMSIHDSKGKYEGGEYTNGKLLAKGKTAYCANCDEKLPFKLNREEIENVED